MWVVDKKLIEKQVKFYLVACFEMYFGEGVESCCVSQKCSDKTKIILYLMAT